MIARVYTRLKKDSTRMCTIVPLNQSAYPSVPINLVEIREGDAEVSLNIKMGEKRKAPELSSQGEGTLVTSTLAPNSNSELMCSFLLPLAHPLQLLL